MNGIFNENSLLTLVMARGLKREQQLTTALAAGQMPRTSYLGPLLLQPIIRSLETAQSDQSSAESELTGLRQALEAAQIARAAAEAEAAALRRALEVELPSDAAEATLRLPGVTGVSFTRVEASSSPGTTVNATTGVVSLPSANTEATVAVAQDGVVRNVTLLRGPRTSVLTGGQVVTSQQLASLAQSLIAALQSAIRASNGSVTGNLPTAEHPRGTPPASRTTPGGTTPGTNTPGARAPAGAVDGEGSRAGSDSASNPPMEAEGAHGASHKSAAAKRG